MAPAEKFRLRRPSLRIACRHLAHNAIRTGITLVLAGAAAGCPGAEQDADEESEGRDEFVAGLGTHLDENAPLHPGPGEAERLLRSENPFEGDAEALQEGERLWRWFNCNGCHGTRGGGGIGPPFADGSTIYGSSPASLFQSIVQGRPEGMPAFGGMLPEQHVWELVTYIQAILRDELPRMRTRDEPDIRTGEWEEGMLDARRLRPGPRP